MNYNYQMLIGDYTGVQPTFVVRPDRAYILAGGNPVKERFSKSLCIKS